MKKTPTKIIPIENSEKFKEVINEDYKYENWITRLHTDNRVTKFNSPDKEIKEDKKDSTVYDLYILKLRNYENMNLISLKNYLM